MNSIPSRDVVVIDAVRTPIGRYGGALASVRPDDLAALAIRALLERTGVAGSSIDDVYFGAANQSGEDNRNVARMAALLAGCPVSVPGVTLNRLCGSSLQAINSAAAALAWGEGEIAIAGGVESMTRAPFVQMKATKAFERGAELFDTTIGWRMINPAMPKEWTISLGETAEKVAEQFAISRAEQDEFAFASQTRAKAAIERGAFEDEIVPVRVDAKGSGREVTTDEHPRPDTTMESLASLRPAFRREGTVTAGNASGINDGAAALLLATAETARGLGCRPLARVVSAASAGVAPDVMGLGPIPAARKALHRANLSIDDIDLVELNEAFASQSIACLRELGIAHDRANVNGGSIALGHPLGASGARISTTLLHEMRRRGARYGMATMCIGVGQGIATIFERIAE